MSIKSKFCPLCGNDAKKLIKGLCENCFRDKTPIGVVPKKLEFYVCPKCQKYFKQGRWIRQTYLSGAIKYEIRNSLKLKGEGRIRIVVNNDKTNAHVITRWYLDEKQEFPKEDDFDISLKIHGKLCDECFKRGGGYYVSIIQLRGSKDDIQDALEKIESLEDLKENWFISKIEKTRGGINLHIGSKDMDKKIEQMFKGNEIKRSYSLITKKDGQDLYRNTVLIRL